MLGVVVHAPHDLRIEEVPEQRLKPGDVLVRIAAGGICGSDLHYFNHGGMGAIRLREPMILGHEVAGTVEKIGGACRGSRSAPGSPSTPAAPAAVASAAARACTITASICDSWAAPCASRMSRADFARRSSCMRRRRCRWRTGSAWGRPPWPSRWRFAFMRSNAPAR